MELSDVSTYDVAMELGGVLCYFPPLVIEREGLLELKVAH